MEKLKKQQQQQRRYSFSFIATPALTSRSYGSHRGKMKFLVLACVYGLASSFSSQPRRASFVSRTALGASVVVISPPGGVGEVAAVKAASMGASVRWFVVSSPEEGQQQQQVVLAPNALEEISQAGGQVELAGADAASLLLPSDDSQSAIAAVSTWCGAADALVCAFDASLPRKKTVETLALEKIWKDAVKVAAQQASTKISGKKIAVLAADDEKADADMEEIGKGISGFLDGLMNGGKQVDVPESLAEAMSTNAAQIISLRHGQLFGTPESSPDFSALVGGPRKEPELCEEYYTRSIRVDPTMSVSGNLMMGETTRSSRHAVGEGAALLALNKVKASGGLDVCLSSLRGSDFVTIDEWQKELDRVAQMATSSVSGDLIPLFATEFSSVPDVNRLTDWLATKWAPAVLRTYDIAAIRVGGRPVYANKIDETTVEIVWQQLVDFESKMTGKMILKVSKTGLVASRAAGDASMGYGTISRTPLGGEDVLVRRLAEAASQAIDKGLAKKVRIEIALALIYVATCPTAKLPFSPSHYLMFLRVIDGSSQGGAGTSPKTCSCCDHCRFYHSSIGRRSYRGSQWSPSSRGSPVPRTEPWYAQRCARDWSIRDPT
jgi:hypothetical protein